MPPPTIQMPGPPNPDRATAVQVAAIPIDAQLPAGPRLLDALAALLQTHAVESACLTLEGGALGPFAYVIPALSPDAAHPAFYSATRRPPGATALEAAAATVGVRGGKPFFHIHALWTDAAGQRGCGHVLPDETVIAAPIRAHGAGIVGARFTVTPDAETGFSLFMPNPTGTAPPPGAAPALAFRLAPNQELAPALEALAATAGFPRARLHGGVASLIGARFHDAPTIAGFATELLVRHATVAPGQTAIDIAIVDLHGAIGEGRLTPQGNPVFITFEGLLQPD